LYIVGFRAKSAAARFRWPTLRRSRCRTLADLLEPDPPAKVRLGAKTWACLQRHRAHHTARGQGFGFTVADPAGITRTLSARYHKDGAEILIPWKSGGRPRRLTPRECARLQGFPDSFVIPVSDTQAYRQFGNAVTVPVAAAVLRAVVRAL
jgi:DNA (cytosine-5)-methyltransferase 1